MSVIDASDLRAYGREVGICRTEELLFLATRKAKTLAFYTRLRHAMRGEYDDDEPFYMCADDLAQERLLPGHDDRKLYLRLIAELLRLGVIIKIANEGFDYDRRRVPATYKFTKFENAENAQKCEVVSFAQRKLAAERARNST
jgi:hypothetical protein